MRRTSTTFQPYDRATGTELSPQQQQVCQSCYAIIKAYIDEAEDRTEAPLPWARKALRCSTAELLDSINALANDITHRQWRDTIGTDGVGTAAQGRPRMSIGDRVTRVPDVATVTPEFYQQAVNLLHELVSRLADVTGVSETLSPQMVERPYLGPPTSLPASTSDSSGSGTTFSQPTASQTSYTDLAGLGGSKTSHARTLDETLENQKLPEKTIQNLETSLDEHSPESTFAPNHILAIRKKVTNDWVLEYLRGGWLANDPVTSAHSSILPVSQPANDDSPTGSFRPLLCIDSNEVSAYSGSDSPRHFRTGTNTSWSKTGRPIPTIASRFTGISRQDRTTTNTSTSTASALEYFATPRSITSGTTFYSTPTSGLGHADSAANVR